MENRSVIEKWPVNEYLTQSYKYFLEYIYTLYLVSYTVSLLFIIFPVH
jgi:hypothetical protein